MSNDNPISKPIMTMKEFNTMKKKLRHKVSPTVKIYHKGYLIKLFIGVVSEETLKWYRNRKGYVIVARNSERQIEYVIRDGKPIDSNLIEERSLFITIKPKI